MSIEREDEPTVAFTPTWDPVWDDEPVARQPSDLEADAALAAWPPTPSPAPERTSPEPPISALVPAAGGGNVDTLEPLDRPDPFDAGHESERERTGPRPADVATPKPVSSKRPMPVGRTRRALSRFRSAVVLAIVVVLSGIALALAFGLAVGVVGFVLKKTVGG